MIRILICTGCENRLVKCTCSVRPDEERPVSEEMDLFTESEVGDFLDKTLDRILTEKPETATLLRSVRAEGIEGIYPKPKGRATEKRFGASVRGRRKASPIAGRKIA